VKLRYTGPDTVTFITAGVGEVEPGAEFTVLDEVAKSFTSRNDIDVVVEGAVTSMIGTRSSSSKIKTVVDASPEPPPEIIEPAPAAATETS
jgi:hypothetical protein